MTLSEARKAPIYQECMRASKKWYLVNWPVNQILEIVLFRDKLKGMRNHKKTYMNNIECQWDELFGFDWCVKNRTTAYRPNEYCFGIDEKRLNIWGCKMLDMHWTDSARWFSYGKYEKEDVFVFDKNRIWHSLSSGINHYKLCPYLRINLINTVYRLFPTEINLSLNKDWKHKEIHQQTPGSIIVRKEETYDGASFIEEYYSDGVVPAKYEVARDILEKAFEECGIADIEIKTWFHDSKSEGDKI